MTRRKKTLMYGAIAFAVCVVLILTTAYSQGADPFHPRTRHIWALSLFAALYASFRGARIVEQLMRKLSNGGQGRYGLFKSEHAIDKRMAARKARVEAAQQRQDDETETEIDDERDLE